MINDDSRIRLREVLEKRRSDRAQKECELLQRERKKKRNKLRKQRMQQKIQHKKLLTFVCPRCETSKLHPYSDTFDCTKCEKRFCTNNCVGSPGDKIVHLLHYSDILCVDCCESLLLRCSIR